MPPAKPIRAYKALNADFKCRGFQYEVGQTYEHAGPVEMCAAGFHACENPFDVLNYYDLVGSRFAMVELTKVSQEKHGDSKRVAAKLTVEAELSLPEFIDAAIKWVFDAAKGAKKKTGLNSRQASSGFNSQQASSGLNSQQASSGDNSEIKSSGQNAVIASAGQHTTAKGAEDTWISLAEFGDDGNCVGFATGQIGKRGLRPGTWYRAEGGKLVAA